MSLEIDRIYCGDCLDLMKEMPDKSVDLVLTDPPYGVGVEYGSFEDTQENLAALVSEMMPEILRVSKRAMITPGVGNIHLYPKPDWILAWFSSAGVGSGPWGYCCWQPILVYGKDPYLSAGKGRRPDIFESNEGASVKVWHPCAKPINLWMDILRRGSVNEGDLVLDPFLGSGTTAIACLRTGRHYIGIEKHEPYFLKAQERIAKERQQARLISRFDFEEATS